MNKTQDNLIFYLLLIINFVCSFSKINHDVNTLLFLINKDIKRFVLLCRLLIIYLERTKHLKAYIFNLQQSKELNCVLNFNFLLYIKYIFEKKNNMNLHPK